MADIAGLSVKLGLVTVEWDAATEKAKRQAKDLRNAFDNLGVGFSKAAQLWKQFGTAISVGGFTALLGQTAQFADDVVDIGNSFELTTQQVLAFRDAITSAGGKADGAEKILSTLYSKIDEGRQGNDKAIAQFEKLGITFGDLKKMDTYEAITKVAKGFENINDAFERTKMIKDFFGKAGIGLSIDQINSALATGTKKYDEYADALKKVGVISDNIKRSMDNLKIAIAQMMAPFIGDGVVSIKDFHRTLSALATGAIVAGVLSLVAAFLKLGVAIKEATAAGSLFNLMAMPTNPIGIAIRLLAAGATAIVFFSGNVDNTKEIAKMYNDNPAVKDKLAADAKNRLLFTKEPPAAETSTTPQASQVNPEVQAKMAQVTLARQLAGIEARRIQANANALTNGEMQTKLTLVQLSLEEKLAQIEGKRASELLSAKDNTSAFKAQINALANVEIEAAKQVAAGQTQEILLAEKLAAVQRKAKADARDYAETAQSNQEMADYLAQQQLVSEQIRLQFADSVRAVDLANDRANYESKLVMYGREKRTTLLEMYDLEAKITEFVREQTRLGQSPEVIQERAQAIRDAGAATIALRIEAENTQRTWEYGWAQAFNAFIDYSTNAALTAQQQFSAFTNNISSAIDTFVQTGKFSFTDFRNSIIRDLVAIELKMQAMALFRSTLSYFGFNADAPIKTGYGGGVPGAYADGGSPPVGVPSLVGERGPELFVPKSAGTIIPNNQLSSVMGGGQTVNYNGPFIANMSAIDTQSAVQFLSKNKSAVWAANQSAQRSLPMSK